MAIVDRMKPRLLGIKKEKLVKRQTVDLDAYNLYLRGRFFWNKQTEEGFKKAIECFEQVIKIDPDYAPAYAGLADSYALLPFYSISLPEETYPRARDAAMKALEIDDTLAEAYVSLAYTTAVYEWNWEGAEKGFKQALEIAAKIDCDYLIHSGDLFDIPVGRNFSGPTEYSRAFVIRELKNFFEKTNYEIGSFMNF